MKKRIIGIILASLLLGLVLAVVQFYWTNLRGSGPALGKPPQNIADLIPKSATTTPAASNTTGIPLKLPTDFSVSIYAKGLDAPRVMTYGPDGSLLVSIPSQGKVVSLRDANGDGFAETVTTVAERLNKPHGLATRCVDEACELYIAEENQVAMYDYDNSKHVALSKKKIVDLPAGGRHVTRTLMFMPYPNDQRLLISVGSSCDVCLETTQRAAILSVNADGTDLKPYANGLRNSVFMAIHPVSGDIWATEMGRDRLGDNLPPDEINIIKESNNYGWPTCYGKNVHDTDFDKNTYIRNPCIEPFETPSYIDLPAHSAPLGIAFFPEEGWPQEYWHNALVAFHGSWNRTEPTGYKIVRIPLDASGMPLKGATRLTSRPVSPEDDFITGWLTDKGALGRPVDILIQPGGTIFVSDDKAGVIYKILYRPDQGTTDERIHLWQPSPNDTVTSPLKVTGEARGTWYFEASFPVKLTDTNGTVIATGIAQAQSDWMTEEFVPFEAQLEFTTPQTDTGTLILQRDNPSSLPEHDASISIPVRFPPRF